MALYETAHPAGRDHEYYRSLADTLGAGKIIDLGCGTGLLTRTLTAPGREVIGVDPSPHDARIRPPPARGGCGEVDRR
ncbi:MAG: class I SAM-dependent methyltransferase [Arthrobacter sp.]|uniref:class I SAM-dependent methyltransferase n=1 Tax=unclassified Arthrobacter TaxID=235627 RepID=UPI00264D7B32|nr:class I SAM-dependent methyltransferase [Micrococcaceae bacterium]MDN5886525.1 class I SAM-dependent methyltransferase [Micrococcaceae bacterium]MDN6169591.1 class I SAM-dependent methyltransferase [Micrococcaceae bacterium]